MNQYEPKGSTNLLAIAVGIKQKESVNKIVSKVMVVVQMNNAIHQQW